jgi:hypothetical protein
MADDQLIQHRVAYEVVMTHIPGSEFISHQTNLEAGWDTPEVHFPPPPLKWIRGCPICGDPKTSPGLAKKCQAWHKEKK